MSTIKQTCVHGRNGACVYCDSPIRPYKPFELYICVPIIVDADTENDARSIAHGLVNGLAAAKHPIIRVGKPDIHRVSELTWDDVAEMGG